MIDAVTEFFASVDPVLMLMSFCVMGVGIAGIIYGKLTEEPR